MATHPLGAESALANPLNIFAAFDRATIAQTVEVLVCVLDAMDGEPDTEDATDLEDDFAVSSMAEDMATGPGCEIADSDSASWAEFHTRGKRKAFPPDLTFHEDDEEDDAPEEDDHSGACDEDEISAGLHSYGWFHRGPGCELSDPGGSETGGY